MLNDNDYWSLCTFWYWSIVFEEKQDCVSTAPSILTWLFLHEKLHVKGNIFGDEVREGRPYDVGSQPIIKERQGIPNKENVAGIRVLNAKEDNFDEN